MARPRLNHLIDGLAGLGRRGGPPSGVIVISSGGLGDTVLFALVMARFQALAEDGEEIRVVLRHDAAAMAFLFPPEVTVEVIDYRRLRRGPAYRLSTLRRLGRLDVRCRRRMLTMPRPPSRTPPWERQNRPGRWTI